MKKYQEFLKEGNEYNTEIISPIDTKEGDIISINKDKPVLIVKRIDHSSEDNGKLSNDFGTIYVNSNQIWFGYISLRNIVPKLKSGKGIVDYDGDILIKDINRLGESSLEFAKVSF